MFANGITRRSNTKRQHNRRLAFEALEDRRVLANLMADIVVAYDESSSAAATDLKSWLSNSLFPALEDLGLTYSLKSKGIDNIQYGLVGFGGGTAGSNWARSFVVNAGGTDKMFGTNSQLAGAVSNLTENVAGFEDGWDAIEHIVAEYKFRAGSVPVILMLQNAEGRNGLNKTLTCDGIVASLESKGILLNVLVAVHGFSNCHRWILVS